MEDIMNKKVILSWLSLLILLVASVHVPVASAANMMSSGSAALSLDSDDDPEDPDETPTPEPPLKFPPPVTPIVSEPKPDLDNPAELSDRPLSTIIGFTFPSGISGGGTIPLEVAAFLDIQPPASDGFTRVGIVVVNPEAGSPGIDSASFTRNDDDDDDDDNDRPTPTPTPTPDPGSFVSAMYIVEIDVLSTDDIVLGRLVSTTSTETVDVNFKRIPQIVNPQREEAIYPEFQLDFVPTNAATIASNSVCFVVNATGDGFIRYCSVRETSPLLSVRDSFPTQYTDLKNMILAAAARIGHQAPLALSQTLSTIEDGQRIADCANATDDLAQQTACASDIIFAPVTREYFEEQLKKAFGGNGDGGGDDKDDGDDRDNGNDGENGKNGDQVSQTVSQLTASIAADDDNGENDDHGKNDDHKDNDDRDNDDRDKDPDKPGSRRTPIDMAVLRVLQPVQIVTEDPAGTVSIQPGDYRVDYWFDVNGVFYAATITGLTTDNTMVINQQIPAIPAIFINADGMPEPSAEISACRGFGRCILWERC
jgi:hypothetical protein